MVTFAGGFGSATFDGVQVKGQLWGTTYDSVGFALEKRNGYYDLTIYMPRNETLGGAFGGFPLVITQGSSYGTVSKSDYVFINTNSRQVYVNGELRQPE